MTWNLWNIISTETLQLSKSLLFRSTQIKYIVSPSDTLRILASLLRPLGLRPRMALTIMDIRLLIRNQDLISPHKLEVQAREKNKWAWVSSSCRQNTQKAFIEAKWSRSFVFILPNTVSQRMKLYLGIDQGSQTILSQVTLAPWALRKS